MTQGGSTPSVATGCDANPVFDHAAIEPDFRRQGGSPDRLAVPHGGEIVTGAWDDDDWPLAREIEGQPPGRHVLPDDRVQLSGVDPCATHGCAPFRHGVLVRFYSNVRPRGGAPGGEQHQEE